MKNLFKSRRGSSIVIFAVSAIVLLGFVGLVTDIGMMTLQKSRLTNAVDSAALAGAQELIYDVDNAQSYSIQYLQKNGFTDVPISVLLEDDDTAVRVTASYEVKFGLAKVLGFDSETITATAKGKVLPVVGVNEGVRPFAIQDQSLEFGNQYTLKEGAGEGEGGNYGGVGLGGTGANVYFNNITNGYDGRLMVGDYIDTEPGNMSGPTESGINTLINGCDHFPRCTFDNFEPDCPKIITVIMVDSLVVQGRASVQIKGFASFFLEGVAGVGHDSVVTGRFIRTITTGEISESQSNYGLYGVRLME